MGAQDSIVYLFGGKYPASVENPTVSASSPDETLLGIGVFAFGRT